MIRSFYIVFISLLFLTPVFASSAFAAYSTPINIGPAGLSFFPSVDADNGGVIHAVWAEESSDGLSRDIIYTKSTDDGVTFPSANRKNISNSTFLSTSPKIKLDTNNVIHIVWEEQTADGKQEIYYAQSTNGGATFSAPQNISSTPTQDSVTPNVETSGANRVYVSWTEEVAALDRTQVYLARSTDGGSTFLTPVNISNTSHYVDTSVMLSKGGLVIIIWQAEGPDYGIYRVVSNNNGSSFGSVLNITGNTTNQLRYSKLAIDGLNRVHVVAQYINAVTSDGEIYYMRSLDSGSTFETARNVSNSSGEYSSFPSVRTIGNDTVKISWSEEVGDSRVIVESGSVDGGAVFDSPTATDFLSSAVEDSDFDIFGSTLYVIYQEGNTIKFKKGSKGS